MGGGCFPPESSSSNKKGVSMKSKLLFKKEYPVDPRQSAMEKEFLATGKVVVMYPDPMHETWKEEMKMVNAEVPQKKPHLKLHPHQFQQDAMEELMKLYEAGESSAVLKIPECFTNNDQSKVIGSLEETLPKLMRVKDANGKVRSFSVFYVKEINED